MAFNHSDTDRIAVYPNRPPKKTMGYLGNRRLLMAHLQSSRSGSESFGFRSLSSHTTVRAVRHTVVWFAFKGVFTGHLSSFLISAAN